MRELTVDASGAADLEAAALKPDELIVTPAAWEAFNARAVSCSLEGLSADRNVLRFAVVPPHAALEISIEGHRERVLAPASAAPAWFWTTSGLWTSGPRRLPSLDEELLGAIEAWTVGEEPAGDGWPQARRLRVGAAGEPMSEDILVRVEGMWLRAHRYVLEDEPTLVVEAFSMKELVLDLSALLAGALTGD